MQQNAGIIQQARMQIASASQVRDDLAQFTTTLAAFTQINNCLWTAQNTMDALLTVRATSPDDLAAALRRLAHAVPPAQQELQRLRPHP